MSSLRASGRRHDELRPAKLETEVLRHPEGSCQISVGETRVICTASVEDRVPSFLHGSGEGWVTAEYGMLPRATNSRVPRERAGSKPSGRSAEIQRLVGRALRAVVDRKVFGERTLWVDCDVIQADGGTRCAAVTGGYVALALAFGELLSRKQLAGKPLVDTLGAVSVGLVAGEALLDLDYVEDSSAEADVNVVRTGAGRYVEVQGTAEERPFDRGRLVELLDLADAGIDALVALQREALGEELLGQLLRRGEEAP